LQSLEFYLRNAWNVKRLSNLIMRRENPFEVFHRLTISVLRQ
jgi:hypothetical protein